MSRPLIAERYEILRLLGRGGMAEVFLARQNGDRGFEKHVVIKRILPHLADDEDFVEMLFDEARTAAELRHPNIAHVFDVGHEDGRTYIAMEFVHGQDLRRVQRRAQRDGGVPLVHAMQIAIDISAGLYSAHTCKDIRGVPLDIVHRDINPQNVLVSYEGVTKIVDFGIAKARSNQSNTETGVIKGKYSYMSPEQAGGQEIDARSDQFAVGIVLWELIAGKRLFKRSHDLATLAAVTDDVIPRPSRFSSITKSLDDVVMRALRRDPDKRFPDCRAMMMALEDLLAEERMAHSSARVGVWMRDLFSDVLNEQEGKLLDAEQKAANPDFDGATVQHPRTLEDKFPSLEVAALQLGSDERKNELPSTRIARKSANDVAPSLRGTAEPAPPPEELANASFAVTDPGATELMSSPPSFEASAHVPAGLHSRPDGAIAMSDASAATRRSPKRSSQQGRPGSDEPLRIADDATETSTAGYVANELADELGATVGAREKRPRTALAPTIDSLPDATVRTSFPDPTRTEVVDRARFSPVPANDGLSWRVVVIAMALGAVALMSTFLIALVAGPGEGRVHVETTPPGAQVFLDGANTRKKTPTILDDVKVGIPHQVRVQLDGYPSQQFEITLTTEADAPKLNWKFDAAQ